MSIAPAVLVRLDIDLDLVLEPFSVWFLLILLNYFSAIIY